MTPIIIYIYLYCSSQNRKAIFQSALYHIIYQPLLGFWNCFDFALDKKLH